jgi:hypothetical protein
MLATDIHVNEYSKELTDGGHSSIPRTSQLMIILAVALIAMPRRKAALTLLLLLNLVAAGIRAA